MMGLFWIRVHIDHRCQVEVDTDRSEIGGKPSSYQSRRDRPSLPDLAHWRWRVEAICEPYGIATLLIHANEKGFACQGLTGCSGG